MNQLDHIVIAAPDLERAKGSFERRTGVAPVDGGRHSGLGTRNALVSLGDEVYLEIIAPDPTQSLEGTFGAALRALPEERLLHWAVRVSGLDSVAARARDLGLSPGPVRRTSREQPDGSVLVWELLGIGGHELGGFVPFYIDWLDCPHPSLTSPFVGALVDFDVTLPPRSAAAELIVDVRRVHVAPGDARVHLAFESPMGQVTYDTSSLPGFRL